ncbi:hypothetical protein EV363DRAFT_1144836, partial [Boletus edulis]
PPGYGWEHRDQAQLVAMDPFISGIDSRDLYRVVPRCLVCGKRERWELQHCHIIPKSAPCQWMRLKELGWLPPQAKHNGANEARNGILLCKDHHHHFDNHNFFIRFFPDTKKFVYNGKSIAIQLEPFHGKAIPLDINHHLSPFPSLFLEHETRSRTAHLFTPTLNIPDSCRDIPDQDWTT